jgi:hypothetical protein
MVQLGRMTNIPNPSIESTSYKTIGILKDNTVGRQLPLTLSNTQLMLKTHKFESRHRLIK